MEGTIEGYSFIMNDVDVIEVWTDSDSEFPHSFIYLAPGTIKSRKDFDFEISNWFFKNK